MLLRRPLSSLPKALSSTPHRHLHSRIPIPPVPRPTPFVPNVTVFLTLIGRNLAIHASKFPSWSSLFTLTSPQLRDLGIEPPRSRRYLLRWRDKFRHGEFGVGGDAVYVSREQTADEGKAVSGAGLGMVEIRAVDVPVESKLASDDRRRRVGPNADGELHLARAGKATISRTPGLQRVVVNVLHEHVPVEESIADPEAADESTTKSTSPRVQTSPAQIEAARLMNGYKLTPGHGVRGPYAEAVKGSQGMAAVVRVKEGMWEHRRGQKVDGGERRKAEVRSKRRAAERKAAA